MLIRFIFNRDLYMFSGKSGNYICTKLLIHIINTNNREGAIHVEFGIRWHVTPGETIIHIWTICRYTISAEQLYCRRDDWHFVRIRCRLPFDTPPLFLSSSPRPFIPISINIQCVPPLRSYNPCAFQIVQHVHVEAKLVQMSPVKSYKLPKKKTD